MFDSLALPFGELRKHAFNHVGSLDGKFCLLGDKHLLQCNAHVSKRGSDFLKPRFVRFCEQLELVLFLPDVGEVICQLCNVSLSLGAGRLKRCLCLLHRRLFAFCHLIGDCGHLGEHISLSGDGILAGLLKLSFEFCDTLRLLVWGWRLPNAFSCQSIWSEHRLSEKLTVRFFRR